MEDILWVQSSIGAELTVRAANQSGQAGKKAEVVMLLELKELSPLTRL